MLFTYYMRTDWENRLHWRTVSSYLIHSEKKNQTKTTYSSIQKFKLQPILPMKKAYTIFFTSSSTTGFYKMLSYHRSIRCKLSQQTSDHQPWKTLSEQELSHQCCDFHSFSLIHYRKNFHHLWHQQKPRLACEKQK